MAIIEFPRVGQASPESGTVVARAVRAAETTLNLGARMWTALKNRRVAGRLAAFDDHMLSDIGLTRGDVYSALAGPVMDDPTERLVALSRERRAARAHRHGRSMEI